MVIFAAQEEGREGAHMSTSARWGGWLVVATSVDAGFVGVGALGGALAVATPVDADLVHISTPGGALAIATPVDADLVESMGHPVPIGRGAGPGIFVASAG